MLTLMLARVVAVAVLIEAALVGGFGVYLAVSSVTSQATELPAAIVMAVFFLVVAAALVVLARALVAGRRWARSPILLWQVLLGAVAAEALSIHRLVEVGVLALCLIAGLGVLALVRDGGEPTASDH